MRSMEAPSIRHALYVLYARLLAGPPDEGLYDRLRREGLLDLARAQGVDLFGDLDDPENGARATAVLDAEYWRLTAEISLHAADYDPGARDPGAALSAYMCEHGLRLDDSVDLGPDHLSVVLGLMGELSGQAEDHDDDESRQRARAFFRRHLDPWAQSALAEVAGHSRLRFYRGLASMISSFLANERRHFGPA